MCRHLTLWSRVVPQLPRVAVNISPVCFREEAQFTRVVDIIDAAGHSPAQFEIEITENIFLKNPGIAESVLEGLRQRGATVSLDDFGIGYSSLARLKTLPIDVLKIDRTFVDGIATEANDRSLCQAIVAVAQALGIRVIAEGVETELQREALRKMLTTGGLGQGFLYSHPLPGEAVPAWLGICPPRLAP